jgi:hypothetical protein
VPAGGANRASSAVSNNAPLIHSLLTSNEHWACHCACCRVDADLVEQKPKSAIVQPAGAHALGTVELNATEVLEVLSEHSCRFQAVRTANQHSPLPLEPLLLRTLCCCT